jgi:hypothetical protein
MYAARPNAEALKTPVAAAYNFVIQSYSSMPRAPRPATAKTPDMRLTRFAVLCFFLIAPLSANAQDSARDDTRTQLSQLLQTAGARDDVNVSFRQSAKNPYNFVGIMTTGLVNSQSLEIVVSVTKSSTIGFRVYPHYKGGYINLGRAKNPNALMHKLLYFSDQNFLFWGADDTADVFSGYTITLESGFPADAITIVLRSVRNTDKFVGQLTPYI